VGVGVAVGVAVGVCVAVEVAVTVGVCVGETVAVAVGLEVCVPVAVGVAVGGSSVGVIWPQPVSNPRSRGRISQGYDVRMMDSRLNLRMHSRVSQTMLCGKCDGDAKCPVLVLIDEQVPGTVFERWCGLWYNECGPLLQPCLSQV